MIGVLVQLAISWILLWFVEKEHLSALGITPTKKRISQLSLGIALAVVCSVAYFSLALVVESKGYEINPHFTFISFLKGIYWVLNSVLFEELIFRGALLYIAMKRMGVMKACLLSAICFGVYHWFSFGVWGNPVPMIFVFLMTGIWGFMFAMSFVKTKSLYLPIGLHFGWNFVTIIIFFQRTTWRAISAHNRRARCSRIDFDICVFVPGFCNAFVGVLVFEINHSRDAQSQVNLIKHIARKMPGVAAWARNFFETVFLIQFHRAIHRVEGFEVTEFIANRFSSLQAFCKYRLA